LLILCEFFPEFGGKLALGGSYRTGFLFRFDGTIPFSNIGNKITSYVI